MPEKTILPEYGYKTLPITSRMAKPVLRQAYRTIAKISAPRVKQKWYERLYLIRNWLHPKGKSQIAKASLDTATPILVNVCEKVGGDIYYDLEFEPTELDFVRKTVAHGETFFDVGANIGIYSLIASGLVGAAGKVHSFEPLDQVFEILQKNLLLNDVSNVTANCVGVSDVTGEAELLVNQESALTSMGQTNRGKVIQKKKVPLITLDEYADKKEVQRSDFLKIDVEGYEGHVLRGSEGLIRRSKELIILCELSEKNYRPLNLSVNDVLEWIRMKGFEIWEVHEDGRHPSALLQLRDSYGINNFIFVRPNSAKRNLLLEMSKQ